MSKKRLWLGLPVSVGQALLLFFLRLMLSHRPQQQQKQNNRNDDFNGSGDEIVLAELQQTGDLINNLLEIEHAESECEMFCQRGILLRENHNEEQRQQHQQQRQRNDGNENDENASCQVRCFVTKAVQPKGYFPNPWATSTTTLVPKVQSTSTHFFDCDHWNAENESIMTELCADVLHDDDSSSLSSFPRMLTLPATENDESHLEESDYGLTPPSAPAMVRYF